MWLPADETRWEAFLSDDEPPELAFYCPDCAKREFGNESPLSETRKRQGTEHPPRAAGGGITPVAAVNPAAHICIPGSGFVKREPNAS